MKKTTTTIKICVTWWFNFRLKKLESKKDTQFLKYIFSKYIVFAKPADLIFGFLKFEVKKDKEHEIVLH